MIEAGGQIIILGAGESGTGAAMLGHQMGYKILLVEEKNLAQETAVFLNDYGIAYQQELPSSKQLNQSSWLIKSPGIPPWHKSVKAANEIGIPVIGEIEFASWFTTGTIIGVTGTNGKTTTVSILHSILTDAGYDAGLAGNTGVSFARQLANEDHAYWVLEISSFQLEDIQHYRNHIGILLNITPDHLNRYPGGMRDYAAAKFRITENQGVEDVFIYNSDDANIQKWLPEFGNNKPERLPFSQENHTSEVAYSQDGVLTVGPVHGEEPLTIDLRELPINGPHNQQNLLAALQAAKVLGVPHEVIKDSLKDFEGIPHRMESFAGKTGVAFINDSKGSNPEATYYALKSSSAPVIWIAGGLDKGNDYNSLKPLVKAKVKHLIALGKDNTPLKEAFDQIVPISDTKSMKAAAGKAYQMAEPGDTVLLSPACASFDLFRDFTDRGDQFKKAVKDLVSTDKTPSSHE